MYVIKCDCSNNTKDYEVGHFSPTGSWYCVEKFSTFADAVAFARLLNDSLKGYPNG